LTKHAFSLASQSLRQNWQQKILIAVHMSTHYNSVKDDPADTKRTYPSIHRFYYNAEKKACRTLSLHTRRCPSSPAGQMDSNVQVDSVSYIALSALNPEPAGIVQQRDKISAEVERHDLVRGADEPAADEHCRHGGVATQQPRQRLVHLLPPRILVQLHNHGIHPEVAEQAHHSVAHAGGTLAEDHHRALRRELRNPVHRSVR
jgi:hypothetical protein